jgi:predicted nuclease of predicted toxin-antitoxin system
VDGSAEAAAETQAVTGLLLDEMYPPSLAQQLRTAGHDVVAVLEVEVGLAARTDEDVLTWADRSDRCVVTENVADFARLAQQGFRHSGLVLVSSRRCPRTASGLQRLAKALDAFLSAGELPGRDGITWLH